MIKTMKCWKCDAEIQVKKEEYHNPHKLTVYDKEWNARKNVNKREFCNECRRSHESEIREHKKIYAKAGANLMIERAIKIMERQNIDIYEYREAIQAIEESFNENLERFRSAEEVVATIILIQHEVRVKNNFKIGIYTADIYIQSLTCIVEIDGYMHNNEKAKVKDGDKDVYIRQLLGSEWEIVRIPTKYIHEKAEKLISAIIEIKSKMKALREENCGLLPYGYSKTMDATYRKILKG